MSKQQTSTTSESLPSLPPVRLPPKRKKPTPTNLAVGSNSDDAVQEDLGFVSEVDEHTAEYTSAAKNLELEMESIDVTIDALRKRKSPVKRPKTTVDPLSASLFPGFPETPAGVRERKDKRNVFRTVLLEPPERHYFSASRVDLVASCNFKYYLKYIRKIKEPPSPSQALGTEVHASLEKYLHGEISQDDLHDIAKPGLKFLPPPSPQIVTEGAFSLYDTQLDRPWYGSIDGYLPPETGHPLIIDHKTTKDLRYRKTEEDLRRDPQALIYALAYMTHFDLDSIEMRWIYYSTQRPNSAVTHFTMKWSEALKGYTTYVRDWGKKMMDIHHHPCDPQQKNTAACFNYRRECFYSGNGDCDAYRKSLEKPTQGPKTLKEAFAPAKAERLGIPKLNMITHADSLPWLPPETPNAMECLWASKHILDAPKGVTETAFLIDLLRRWREK